MAKDVIITPDSGKIEFLDSTLLKGKIYEFEGDLYIDGDTIIFGDGTPANIQLGEVGTAISFTFLGGGDLSSNGQTLNIGSVGDTINLNVSGVNYILPSTIVLSSDYTDSNVLSKIKNVDGAGSGLDADLLDGQHGAYYAIQGQTMYIGTTPVAINRASANLALTGISSIGFAAYPDDSASISATISGTTTYFDFNLSDDNNSDSWRWRFTPSGSTVYNAMTLTPVSYGVANLVVAGSITATGTGANSTNWTDAYNKRIQTFTTTGNSGAATFSSNTLNIPNYTLAGLGGAPLSHTHGNINDNGTIGGNLVGATNGDFILIADASDSARLQPGIAIGTGTGTYLRNDGTWSTPPQGTVTSIATTAPISGGTITGSGTISLADNYGDTKNPYASKTAKYFLAAPNGAAGVPTFRAIVASDIPTLNQSTNGSAGSVANTLTRGSYLTGNNFNGSAATTWAVDATTAGAASKILALDANGDTTVRRLNVDGTAGTKSIRFNDNTFISPNSHNNSTWFRNLTGLWTFQSFDDADDWTRVFQLYLPDPGTSGQNNLIAELGQRQSNSTNGSYKGIRIVSYESSAIKDGYLRAGNVDISGNLVVSGNLSVGGTTSIIESTIVTIKDPVFTLGGTAPLTTDDNKDRGIEFRWHNGTTSKTGFFGFDDSTGFFTFIPDATNTSEVFSGTRGIIEAESFLGHLIGNADSANYADVAGSVTNAITFSNTGGSATGTTYNGSGARTIDYSTVGAASSGHVHGSINSNGTITATAITPANTDYILLSDTSNSGKIERGIVIGTGTGTYLRNDGTWSTPPQGTVTSVSGTGSYGGLTLSGSVTSSGNLTLGGTPTGTWPISVTGNAGTVTNGVYTTSSYSDPTWLTISKSKVGLGSVEDTKLSTWTGSTSITTLGTISTGTVPWARLSGVPSSFTPSSHTHGNITNDGKIGVTSGLMIITTTGGALTTLAAGTSGQFLAHNGTWGIPTGTYSLPVAGAAIGGVKSGTDISVDGSGNVSVVDDSHNHSYSTGAFSVRGNLGVTGDIYSEGGQVFVATGDARVKYGMWGNNDTTYGIGMTSGVTYGGLNDYAITFQMSNTDTRGFWWGDSSHNLAQGAMALTTTGLLTVASGIKLGYGENDITTPTPNLLDISGSVKILTGLNVYLSSSGSPNTIYSISASSLSCLIMDYTILNNTGTSQRSGTFMCNILGNLVTTSETSTPDAGGSTAAVTLGASIISSNLHVQATITGSETWTIITSVRYF